VNNVKQVVSYAHKTVFYSGTDVVCMYKCNVLIL